MAGTTAAYAFLAGPLVGAVSAGSSTPPIALPWTGDTRGLLVTLAAALLAITVVRAVAGYGQRILAARLGQSVVRDLRERMYRRLLRADPSTWVGRRHGELASRLSADAGKVQQLVATNAVTVVSQLVTLGGLVALAFTLDPWLAALSLAGVPPIAVAVWWLSQRARRAHRGTHERVADLSALAAELADTAPVIAAYGAEANAEREMARRGEELERQILAAARWSALAQPATQLIGAVAVCAALGVAGMRLLDGALDTPTFVSLLAAFLFMYRPVQAIGSHAQQLALGLSALDRVDEVLGLPADELEPDGATHLGPMREGLSLKGVRFAYSPGEPVLDGVDLSLAPGESVAIAGSSGQGKTTLLALMLGLLRADEGEVLLDGVRVHDASPRSWRAQFAWVTQGPLLFGDTLLHNVALSDPAPDRDRARAALTRAGAAPLLDRLGLDHRLAEGGRGLSGGERQRVCIARALYRDAPILLFDEATSSLDGPSERAVAHTIQSLMQERTVVVVSHRLSTVRRADRVVVIEGGQVVESGSPRSLMETGGRFHELFRDDAART